MILYIKLVKLTLYKSKRELGWFKIELDRAGILENFF